MISYYLINSTKKKSQIPERSHVKFRDGGGVRANCHLVPWIVLRPEDVRLSLSQVGVVADNPGHRHFPDGVKLIQSEPALGKLAILIVEPVAFLQSLKLISLKTTRTILNVRTRYYETKQQSKNHKYQDASEDRTHQGIPESPLQSGSNEQVNVVHILVNWLQTLDVDLTPES